MPRKKTIISKDEAQEDTFVRKVSIILAAILLFGVGLLLFAALAIAALIWLKVI